MCLIVSTFPVELFDRWRCGWLRLSSAQHPLDILRLCVILNCFSLGIVFFFLTVDQFSTCRKQIFCCVKYIFSNLKNSVNFEDVYSCLMYNWIDKPLISLPIKSTWRNVLFFKKSFQCFLSFFKILVSVYVLTHPFLVYILFSPLYKTLYKKVKALLDGKQQEKSYTRAQTARKKSGRTQTTIEAWWSIETRGSAKKKKSCSSSSRPR